MKFTCLWFGNLWFGLQFELTSWHSKLSSASSMRDQDQSFCCNQDGVFKSNRILGSLVFLSWDRKRKSPQGFCGFNMSKDSRNQKYKISGNLHQRCLLPYRKIHPEISSSFSSIKCNLRTLPSLSWREQWQRKGGVLATLRMFSSP